MCKVHELHSEPTLAQKMLSDNDVLVVVGLKQPEKEEGERDTCTEL